MPSRYYEIIITGRQLAGLLAALVVLLFAAFGLGVAVRFLEPEPVQAVPVVAVAPSPTATPEPPAPSPEPTAVPTEPPPPPVIPTSAPTPPPPAVAPETPLPLPPPPTAAPTPRPEPTPVALPAAGGVWVQVAAVSRPDLAEGVKQRVMAFGFRPEQLRVLTTRQGLFKVRLGPFPDLESAGRVVGRLQEAGFEGPFIVRE
ncbi:MAG TPA: SPOR domain-containing protein [Thermoanaerobaculaceae bacterium]|nr:SPOR domain-containing protein [Thermoanaerobaculaceae bacterium]HRS15408.1 SPOR domain-containing protein [Thermoanaerobaculaceae bacterium]